MHHLLDAARSTLGLDAACLFEQGEQGELLRAQAAAADESAGATGYEVPVWRSSGEL